MSFSAWRTAFDEIRRGRVTELVHIRDRARLWRIAEKLDSSQLHTLVDDDEPLTAEALVGATEQRAGKLMLGTYSEAGFVYALQRYGIWEDLENVCKDTPVLVIRDTSESIQKMVIRDGADGPVLVELRAGLRFPPDGDAALAQDLPGSPDATWLSVEWLTLQNPYAEFPPTRPPLPGQDHPGLGIGREVMELLLIMGWRLGCAGLVSHPAWFHNAVMYRLHYRFVDPAEEGRFLALIRDFEGSGLTLAEASRAVEAGKVRDAEGTPVTWTPGPMVAPLVPGADLDAMDGWLERVREAREAAAYRFPARERLRAPPP